jgi:hypothetical protein
VTFNLNDFPAETLAPYGIRAEHPDQLVPTSSTARRSWFVRQQENTEAVLRTRQNRWLPTSKRCGKMAFPKPLQNCFLLGVSFSAGTIPTQLSLTSCATTTFNAILSRGTRRIFTPNRAGPFVHPKLR